MLGGIEITTKAREHAREMLKVSAEADANAAERAPEAARPKTSKRRS